MGEILKSEIIVLKKEVDELQKVKEDGAGAVKTKTKQISELSEALDAKEAAEEKLIQESKSFRENLEDLRQKFANSKKDVGQMSDEIDAQKRDVSAIQKEKSDLEALLQKTQQKA